MAALQGFLMSTAGFLSVSRSILRPGKLALPLAPYQGMVPYQGASLLHHPALTSLAYLVSCKD